MLYRVSRTSIWDDETPPCDGAVDIPVVRVDCRDVDDPKKIPANKGTDGDWFMRGINHRVENGKICRDIGESIKWFVEIGDLAQFVKTNGKCVLDVERNGALTIEIYDDYRE